MTPKTKDDIEISGADKRAAATAGEKVSSSPTLDEESMDGCRWFQCQRVTAASSTTNTVTTLPASLLERILTRRLAVEKGTANDDEEEEYVAVHYAIRQDAHWLKCNDPIHQPRIPLMTLLGILEDEPKHQDLPVHCHLYQVLSQNILSSSSCGNINTKQPQSKPYEMQHKSSLKLQWIDLRQAMTSDSISLKHPGDCYALLQSILKSDHNSSPWIQSVEEKDFFDISILVLPFDSGNDAMHPLLQDFNTSDAAPSWFLHAMIDCDLLELNGECLRQHIPVNPDAPPATLYIYKRLPLRPGFFNQQGQGQQSILIPEDTPKDKNCLWETVYEVEKEENDKNAKNGNNNEEEKPITRLQCPPYVHLEQVYPSIYNQLFSQEILKIFQQEAMRIPMWTPWPETQHYSSSKDGSPTWTVFPLCYCFPAHDVSRRTWVEQTKAFCPQTCQLLLDIVGPRLRTALFSQLKPSTTLEAHTGWADLANHVLRLHIPLVVPPSSSSSSPRHHYCGTWVDGCVQYHEFGKPILFDDSKIHRAFNYHPTQSRIVLIVDVERPPTLPSGYATGGHSEELDAFIQQMSVPK